MDMRNSTKAWGGLAKAFHWLSVLLLIAVWVAVALHEEAAKDSVEYVKYIMLHKALGVSLGAFVVARLIWRSSNVTPTPLAAPAWQQKAASLVHAGLYLALLAMPITGVVMSQLAGKPVSWFGVFEFPQVLDINKELAKQVKDLHEDVFWPLLVLLTLGHIAAAMFHQFILKDNLIKRMMP
jgi:cytochrome b561